MIDLRFVVSLVFLFQGVILNRFHGKIRHPAQSKIFTEEGLLCDSEETSICPSKQNAC